MAALPGATVVRGDFTSPAVQSWLRAAVRAADNEGADAAPFADAVVSDLAPAFMGEGEVDTARQATLARLAAAFAVGALAPGGAVVVKTRQGRAADALEEALGAAFRRVVRDKPPASRVASAELYLLGLGARPMRERGRREWAAMEEAVGE
jgi:23S rRNA (uridine2552-2'-O)-methyltransferase